MDPYPDPLGWYYARLLWWTILCLYVGLSLAERWPTPAEAVAWVVVGLAGFVGLALVERIVRR